MRQTSNQLVSFHPKGIWLEQMQNEAQVSHTQRQTERQSLLLIDFLVKHDDEIEAQEQKMSSRDTTVEHNNTKEWGVYYLRGSRLAPLSG